MYFLLKVILFSLLYHLLSLTLVSITAKMLPPDLEDKNRKRLLMLIEIFYFILFLLLLYYAYHSLGLRIDIDF